MTETKQETKPKEKQPEAKEKKSKAAKKPKAAKKAEPKATEQPAQAASYIVTLWGAIAQVEAIRATTKGDKLHESLTRSSTYLQRAAKQIGEAVAA